MRRKDGFGHVLRDRIDANRAVDNLNDVLHGRTSCTPVELGAIKLALGKVLPDLQAVAVNLSADKPATRHDIDALMHSVGLNPALVWGDETIVDTDAIESQPSKSESE